MITLIEKRAKTKGTLEIGDKSPSLMLILKQPQRLLQ